MKTIEIQEVKSRLENINWHINTNREVLGDKETLDTVQKSVDKMIEFLERREAL